MQTINELGSYTFPALLKNTVKLFAERPALAFPTDEPFTYSQVNQKIEKVRSLLDSIGISAGDKVAIFSRNMPHWGIAYLAIVTMGAVAVPLLPDFNESDVAGCISHSGTNAMIVSKALMSKMPESIEKAVLLDDFSLIRGESKEERAVPVYESSEDDTAAIIYTSGTTGRPKGVELSHKNLVFSAVSCQFAHRVNKYDVFLSILPMSHVYEFTVGFLLAFLNGALVVYLDGPPVPRILMPTLQKVKPNNILSVPLIIEKIYKSKVVPAFNKSKFTKFFVKTWLGRKIMSRIAGKKIIKAMGGRVKFFGIGGSKVDPKIEEFLKDAKFPYGIGYGLTETSPLVAFSNPKTTKPGMIGPAIPGVDVKLLNQNEEGIGELVVKGPNVMKGYYLEPELTKEAFTEDGWFKTGDLCKIDKKGRVGLCGRSKNLILSAAGENIYPEDIEFVLNQHPIVSESLVVEGENSSIVALIKLNEEKLKNAADKERLSHESETKLQATQRTFDSVVNSITDAIAYKNEEVLNEIKFFVNSRVNRTSKINKINVVKDFEKTASQKIKRYLYSILNPPKKSGDKKPAKD
ncbi:MAG: AMP-binding protein [Treponema sp.]|nr:MAG: AMP-binding protein [Treponema sp.]